MKTPQFLITSVCDNRKTGSEISVGSIVSPDSSNIQLDESGKPSKIYITDNANIDWIFYVGDTCRVASKKDIENAREPKIVLGDYYSSEGLRDLCHAIKNLDPSGIRLAGDMLEPLIPNGACLIPVPSSSGVALSNLQIAQRIIELNPSISLFDCLKGKSRIPLYQLKKLKAKVDVDFFGFETVGNVPQKNVFLLDSVFATGATIAAARNAIGNLGYPCPYIVLAQDYTQRL